MHLIPRRGNLPAGRVIVEQRLGESEPRIYISVLPGVASG
jgi:hypothetical protein